MSRRDQVLQLMLHRARNVVPRGEPIFPDGPVATSEDIREFVRLCDDLDFEILFGKRTAMTRTPIKKGKDAPGEVHLTPRVTVGVLTDEFLHAWNNRRGNRGKYLKDRVRGEEHAFLGSRKLTSGGTDDRRLHQMELENFTEYSLRFSGHIPLYVWRTFIALEKAKK
jgi:hypothetical protein